MKPALFFALTILAALAGCASHPERHPRPDEIIANPEGLPGNYVALSGGGCLGTCPDYTIIVFDDGRVLFDGQAYTAYRGIYRTRIPAGRYGNLLKLLDDTRVFTRAEPQECMTDNPAYWIVAKGAGVEPRKAMIDSGCNDDTAFEPVVAGFLKATGLQDLVSRHWH